MQRYFEYYDLSLKEKYDLFLYERKHSTKLYVANSIKDLSNKANSTEHSSFGLINIIVPRNLNISLFNIDFEDDVRKLYCNIFGLSCLDFEYEYPYISTQFNDFSNFEKMGVNSYLFDKLKYNNLKHLNNSYFCHFLGQKYPELVNCNFSILKNRKTIEDKVKANDLILENF